MSKKSHFGWFLATLICFSIHSSIGIIAAIVWGVLAFDAKMNSSRSRGGSQGVNTPPRSPRGNAQGSVRHALPSYVGSATGPGSRVRLSSQGRIGAVGEYYRRKEIRALVGKGTRIGQVGDWDNGLPIEVELVPEPHNRHDRNAVALLGVLGSRREVVGYLAREIAPRWQPQLLTLAKERQTAFCPAMVYRDNHGGFQVVLRLAEPENAFLWNAVPSGAVAVGAEQMATLIGVHRHQEVLATIPDIFVWATLSPGKVWAGKYAGASTIDVAIDGKIVGQLNASQGARYSPVLNAGSLVACEAWTFQGKKNRGMRIWLPRTS